MAQFYSGSAWLGSSLGAARNTGATKGTHAFIRKRCIKVKLVIRKRCINVKLVIRKKMYKG
jgi:hypothetical protein